VSKVSGVSGEIIEPKDKQYYPTVKIVWDPKKIGITAGELKSSLSSNNREDPDVWPMILDKLNAMVAAHGGRPVTENGSLILERSPQDDGRRNGLEVLDELYGELPEGLKERHRLLPCFADYLL